MDNNLKPLNNGRYRPEKIIGKGGFGIIYKALDTKLDVYVAIKEFIPRSTFETDRILKEAKIAAGFYDLDGIVTARDYFEEDGNVYLVTEYIHGMNLKKYIQKYGCINGTDALKKMEPILISLSKIHERGVIHRDISADNMMITNEGRFKLIDFGSAKTLQNITDETLTLEFKRGFAPIEQLNEPEKQGTWTDIYSLCATIYFMVSGIVPENSIERLINDSLLSLNEIYSTNLTRKQKDAIMKGLSLEPKDRYKTIHELYKDLYDATPDVDDDLDFKTETISLNNDSSGMGSSSLNTEALRKQIRQEFGEKAATGKNEAPNNNSQKDLSKLQSESLDKKRRVARIFAIIGIIILGIILFFFILKGDIFKPNNNKSNNPNNSNTATAGSVKAGNKGGSNPSSDISNITKSASPDTKSDDSGTSNTNSNKKEKKKQKKASNKNTSNKTSNSKASNKKSSQSTNPSSSSEGNNDSKSSTDSSTDTDSSNSTKDDSKSDDNIDFDASL